MDFLFQNVRFCALRRTTTDHAPNRREKSNYPMTVSKNKKKVCIGSLIIYCWAETRGPISFLFFCLGCTDQALVFAIKGKRKESGLHCAEVGTFSLRYHKKIDAFLFFLVPILCRGGQVNFVCIGIATLNGAKHTLWKERKKNTNVHDMVAYKQVSNGRASNSLCYTYSIHYKYSTQ